jgi:hypothetical protein
MKIEVIPYEHLELEISRDRFGESFSDPPQNFGERQTEIMWKLYDRAERDFGDKLFVSTNVYRNTQLRVEFALQMLNPLLIDWLRQFLLDNAPDRYIFCVVTDIDWANPEVHKRSGVLAFVLNLKEIVMETDLYQYWKGHVESDGKP